MNKEIILLLFCLVLYCNSTTEEEKLILAKYGEDYQFDFLSGYRTYYLSGSLQDYKELEFKITSEKQLERIRYYYTNRDIYYVEDISSGMFVNGNPSESIVGGKYEYSFTSKTTKATRYLLLSISLSESCDKTFNVSITSKYPTTSIFVKILIGIGLILLLACCIIICKLTGGSALEGVAACLAVVTCCCGRR